MVKQKNKIDIREIFLGLQHQMRSRLTLNRSILTHPVAKGDASELEWIEMLSAYLPKRYCVDKAFIIDCEGNLSEQIDIVIYDRQYSPFILKQNGATYVPAESVYAVTEVKSTLNKAVIEYASKKTASVRRLKRTRAPIVHAGGRIDKPKELFDILAGVLTIDGKCTTGLKAQLAKLRRERFLQFGCSLDHVSFWFKKKEGGGYHFDKSKQEDALIFFFLNLLDELQQLGTVPAIDLRAYIKTFEENNR